MCNILTQISKIADSEGISIGALERKIGASKGVLSRAIANGTDIQSKWVQALVENYPRYNVEWLLTGEGEMFKDALKPVQKPPEPTQLVLAGSSGGIPLIPVEAMAGYGVAGQQVMEHECERYNVPLLQSAEFLIAVRGDSMQPHYNSGDVVACKKVSEPTFFQWNKVYVLDTEQGALIKRVQPGSTDNSLKLISDNTIYAPFEVQKEDVFALAIVLGAIRAE